MNECKQETLKIEDLKVGDMFEYRETKDSNIWIAYVVVQVGVDCLGSFVVLHNDCGPCCHQGTIDQGRLRRHVPTPEKPASVVAEIAKLAEGFEAKLTKQVSDLECELVSVKAELERTKKCSDHDREMKLKYMEERDQKAALAEGNYEAFKIVTRQLDSLKAEREEARNIQGSLDRALSAARDERDEQSTMRRSADKARAQFKRDVARALGMVWMLGMHEPDEAAVLEKAKLTRPPMFLWKTPAQFEREIDDLKDRLKCVENAWTAEKERGDEAMKNLHEIRAHLESWDKSGEVRGGKCSLAEAVEALAKAAKTLDEVLGKVMRERDTAMAATKKAQDELLALRLTYNDVLKQRDDVLKQRDALSVQAREAQEDAKQSEGELERTRASIDAARRIDRSMPGIITRWEFHGDSRYGGYQAITLSVRPVSWFGKIEREITFVLDHHAQSFLESMVQTDESLKKQVAELEQKLKDAGERENSLKNAALKIARGEVA